MGTKLEELVKKMEEFRKTLPENSTIELVPPEEEGMSHEILIEEIRYVTIDHIGPEVWPEDRRNLMDEAKEFFPEDIKIIHVQTQDHYP